MAFLLSGRDYEGVKLRAFPLVLRDEAKTWFQGLQPNERSSWENLKQAFLSRYGGGDNPEDMWKRLTALQQSTLGSYAAYEAQFLKLWNQWVTALLEGEMAPNFLKKERFIAGLHPILQQKVRGKFPETFEEAMQWAKLKD